jgi:dienelactone hydrolase
MKTRIPMVRLFSLAELLLEKSYQVVMKTRIPMVRLFSVVALVGLFGFMTPVRAESPLNQGRMVFNSPGSSDKRGEQIAVIEKKIADLNKQLNVLKTPAAKPRALQWKDARAWKMVNRAALSRDGKWFACSIQTAEGNGETVVRQSRGEKERRFPVASFNIVFSQDNRWVAFATPPMPGTSGPCVGLLDLRTGNVVGYENIASFAFAGEASNVLALHRPGRSSDLILRDLARAKELILGNVSQFAFDKKGDWLALVIEAQGQVGNGVQLRNMKTAALHPLDSDRASYQGLAWSEKGEALAVLKGAPDQQSRTLSYQMLVFRDLAVKPAVETYDPAKDPSFPKGMAISPLRSPSFGDDPAVVYFGIREATRIEGPGPAADPTKGPANHAAASTSEKPDLVIWHGKEERLPSQQQLEARAELMYTYLCAYRFNEKQFLRLADDTLRQVLVAPKGRYALGVDGRATRRSSTLDGQGRFDVHVIDLEAGQRHLALKGSRVFPLLGFSDVMGFSPDGTRFLYHSGGHFHAYDMARRTSVCLSRKAATRFVNAEDDHNVDRMPTPPIGWTRDSQAVLVSDNWDIWKLSLNGDEPVNLTGDGKTRGIRYRHRVVIDHEEKGIDLSAPLYLSAVEEWTKKSGYVRIYPNGCRRRLLWGNAEFGRMVKAKDADVFVYTRETTTEYPDFHATDVDFRQSRRLTTVNPQQKQFQWSAGSVLVDFESKKGDRLQAVLLLPAGYQKGKKYPTVVHIYERLSWKKNHYLHPHGEDFDPALYTSNGYAVLMPDIKYRLNDPGMSALWCVLPALDAAVKTGVVDRDRVGLHGHSWGGYQTAFLVTQTQVFKAAVAGAAPTNLVSMYNSIYWKIGVANQPIFESSQGRFRGGYWDQLGAYLRNSPVIHAKNIKTPLMLLHNDRDGAVDFTQGIEFFNALRRLNKSVVMLQYRGENHSLDKPANQKDYTQRMREFFDHHLMGKPAPTWLEKGVPHLKMDEHLAARASRK